jgi:hypothetical protein
VRARYIAEGEQLLLDIIPAPPNIAAHDVRELSADEAIASNLQIGNFAALITRSQRIWKSQHWLGLRSNF